MKKRIKIITSIILGTMIVILFASPKGYFILDRTEVTSDTSVSAESYYSGVATYLINLDRSKKRLEYVMPKIEKLPFHFERISAVDGKALSDQEIQEKVDFTTYLRILKPPRRGAIGCYLSHLKAWQKLLDSNFEFALILEDDIDFDPAALSEAVSQLILNKEYWDINNFEVRHRGTPLVVKKIGNSDLVVYLTEITNAGGYLISRKAAYKLLEKSLPIRIAVDCYYMRAWEFDLKFTGTEPRLVFQRFGDSEIGATSQSKEKITDIPVIDKLIRHMYRFQSNLIRFFYNLNLYLQLKFMDKK